MDDGGSEIDHRFETCVGFVASHGYALELFQLAEEILDQMAPLIDVLVDVERLGSPGMLRDHDLSRAFVQLFDDPIGIEGLVGDQAAKFDILDQRLDANGVKAMAG